MIVSWYGVDRTGEHEDRLINTTDIYATIANLAGVNVDKIHDSYDFSETFTSKNTDDRDYVYSEVTDGNNSWYTIRNDTYKLIVLDNGNQRLYDLIADPYEQKNILNWEMSDIENSNLQELEEYVSQIQN
jgi:arylsulfatase A-like enzyme